MNVNKININQSEQSYYITSDIYDVSAHNNGVTFESLSALLGSDSLSTLIPSEIRCGGMTIRFIQSSDNKYMQYRLMSNVWSTTVADWEGVDDEPIAISNNIVKSGGVFSSINNEIARATAAEKVIKMFVSDYNSGHLTLASTENGVYLNTEGKKIDMDAYSIAYLNVIDTVRYFYVEARIGASASIQFFDGSDNPIGQVVGIVAQDEIISTKSYIEVPEGCVKIGISYVSKYGLVYGTKNIEDRLTANEEAIEGIENGNLKGKKIGLLGDSIAAGASAADVKYIFINVAANILGATVKNVANGGWYLGDYENKSIYKQVNGVSPSTKSLDGDEDVIVIFAGTNDFGHAFPIGEPFTIDENGHKIASTDETTTCGGLVKTIQTLYEKYNGYIPILICTPIQRLSKGSYSNGGSWDKNDIGKYMDEYIDAIIKTATYYGIPVADFYHNNMNPNISAANTMYFADGLHPNNEGHRLIGVQLAKEIKEKIYL